MCVRKRIYPITGDLNVNKCICMYVCSEVVIIVTISVSALECVFVVAMMKPVNIMTSKMKYLPNMLDSLT